MQHRSNQSLLGRNLLLAPFFISQFVAPSNAKTLIAALGSVASVGYIAPASNRALLNLDTTWKFQKSNAYGAQAATFNDGSWSNINIPHTWNVSDGSNGDTSYYQGVGWYRKHFAVDASYAGRGFYLRFDGSNTVTTVYLNGTLLGSHKGGFAAFNLDATAAIKVGGDNVLAVMVNNAIDKDVAPQAGADFTFFGGIYRSVHLMITDKLSVTPFDFGSSGVYLTPTKVSAASADLQVTVKLRNDNATSKSATISTVITDAAGTIVATLPGTATMAAGGAATVVQHTVIPNPHLWNGLADPYMYQASVEVRDGSTVTDVVEQPLGFRFFKVDPNQGFLLNGSYLDLHGVNRHQDRKDTGWAITEADHKQDFDLIREMGATSIRLAHYQHSSYFYDLCDKNGMVVWAEVPYVDHVNNTAGFFDTTKRQMKELIRQNYNRPSIFFWGCGNEVTSIPASNQLIQQLSDLAHSEDSTRLTTYASNSKYDTLSVNFHTDLLGFNRYYGWYNTPGSTFADFPAEADGFHKSYPNRPEGISEFGAGGALTQHEENPGPPPPHGRPHPEEYQNLFHEAHWGYMKTRKFLWAKYIWNMFDFASDKRLEGDTYGLNDKGMITYDRKTRKDVFFFYKANWTTDPVVYISSRRFTPRAVDTVNVKVYSNLDSVQIFVNDAKAGNKVADGSCVFKWTRVKLQKGPNFIKAIGFKGGIQYTDQCEWTFGTMDAIAARSGKDQGREVRMGADRMLTVINPNAIADLSIADLNGTRVYRQDNIAVGTERISLRTLSRGVYVVTLSGFHATMARRIAVP